MSAATIDRLLAPVRNRGKEGRRRTGISTPLRKNIAVRTFTVTVEDIRKRLPFPLLGLYVHNGRAFVNETLVDYCKQRDIELTRSGAYKKNADMD